MSVDKINNLGYIDSRNTVGSYNTTTTDNSVDNSINNGIINETNYYHQYSERDCVLQWLFSINYHTKHEDIFRNRTENTGVWFLEHPSFVGWLNGEKPILFCHGIPCAGKTIIASIVIENLITKHDKSTATVYVYCDKREERGQTTAELVNSLLYHLLTAIDQDHEKKALYDAILAVYKAHVHEQSNTGLSKKELSRVFKAALQVFNTIFIVIDALDEIPRSERAAFIQAINNLAALGARVLVTSREIVEIEDQFADDSVCRWVEISAAEEDVRAYLKAQINKRPKLKSITTRDPAFYQKICDEIVEKSKGMFLIAKLYLEAVARERLVRRMPSALQGLPAGVDTIYEDVMKQIEQEDDRDVNFAKTVLTWVTYTLRPITIRELQHVVAINDGTMELDQDQDPQIWEEDLRALSAGLVRLNSESGTIAIAHYTVREYLCGQEKHFLPVPHQQISATCLEYLSWDQFPYPSDQHKHLRFIDRYAAENWGHHAREALASGRSDILNEKALGFLTKTQNVTSAYTIMETSTPVHMPDPDTDAIPATMATFFGLSGIVESLLGDSMVKRHRLLVNLVRVAERSGHKDLVNLLLGKFVDIIAKSDDGWSALSDISDNRAIVRLLLENGMAMEGKDKHGLSLLGYASQNGLEAIVRLLWEKAADIMAINNEGSMPLHLASHNGHEAVVRLLLEKGADIKAKDNKGWTVLHRASWNGHEAVVRLLLEKGADIKAKDNEGWTVLHRASWNGHEAVVRLLLEKGADIKAKDNEGWTVLHNPSANGHEAVVRLLLEKGANIQAEDYYKGWTALHRASYNGHEAVVRLLLEKGANVDAEDRSDNTALHMASSLGREAAVRVLLEKGANVQATNTHNRRPLDFALLSEHGTVVRLLREHGALPFGALPTDALPSRALPSRAMDNTIYITFD